MVNENCSYCEISSSDVEFPANDALGNTYFPINQDEKPLCLDCYKRHIREPLMYQTRYIASIEYEFKDLKEYMKECARLDILSEVEKILIKLGVTYAINKKR